MIILELESQKKLSLTDSIKKWLPDQNIIGSEKITIHHLLSHTSGLHHFPDGKQFEHLRAAIESPDELVRLFANRPLAFSPGSKWGYSNANFVVLGLIAEQVSGQSYLKLVNAYIAKPAELSKTGHEERYEIVSHLALPYYLTKDGSYSGLPRVSPMARFAAGSIYSSADDMAKWMQHLITGKDSSGRIFRKMTKPRVSLPDSVAQQGGVPPNYAYGWFVGELDVLGCKTYVVEHGGSILGYSSKLRYFPDHDTIISVTSNTTQNIKKVVNQLSYQFLDSTLCKP
ncbi:beta-lactamase family protein [Parasphingorhabdus cellanae]|uniref:Beta-lactamase family protein n=2 Tax=Parasphingorhabdus cellanae TaxID=2806553 RepID=A0ABX7T6T8_9SPHN|nr:beta-lactamase family protein [Parasphingorhabdus cellanae]